MHIKSINVLIISQQAFLRHGLEIAISSIEDINVMASIDFGNGTEFSLEKYNPSVVILNIDGQEESGLKMSIRIKHHSPNIGVIVLTSTPDDEQIFQALKNQASAFLSKEANGDQIISMIRRVASGEYPINENLATKPSVADRVLEQFQILCMQSEYQPFISPITPRETEVLHLLARGYGNKQMASELGISEQTIKNHITSILRKLNANARTEAVVTAIKQGIISLN